MSNCSWLLNASAATSFCTLHVKANFVFRLFNVSLSFRAQNTKKRCLRFAMFNFSEKLQNIFETGFKKYGVFVQKSLPLKKIFPRKNSQTRFCCLCVNQPTVKIWDNQTKSLWVLPFYNVRNTNSQSNDTNCTHMDSLNRLTRFLTSTKVLKQRAVTLSAWELGNMSKNKRAMTLQDVRKVWEIKKKQWKALG